MKKLFAMVITTLFLGVPAISHAALLDGGISGPLPVYNIDSSVDLATITTQLNTAQQLEAALKNLASMDSSTAAANMGQIQQTLAQLQALQQQVTGMSMDYQNFQQQWDANYGMSGTDYAYQVQQLTQSTQRQIYDAMRAQGLISDIPSDAANLQQLMNASQSSQGALAAAQAGNQISGILAQQIMRMQQIMAQSNQAQLAYQEKKQQQEAMAHEASEAFFQESDEPIKGQGPGFGGFNK